MDLVDPLHGRELLAHRRFVRALAQQLVRDAATADDVTQDAMTRLLEVGRPASIRPWLRTVVRNVARKFGRSERRRAEIEGGRAPDPATDAKTTAPATDLLAARLELQRRLTERVLALEPRARDVVMLHFYEGKTVAETAEQLGIPLETVRTRLRRALEELRANWNGELGGEREGLAGLLLLARWTPAKGLVAAAGATAASTVAAPLFWTGVVAMTTKAKLVAVTATLVVAAAGAFVLWPLRDGPNPPRAPHESKVPPLAAPVAASGPQLADAKSADAPQRQVETLPSPVVATQGTLVVHAHYARDHAAAELTLIARISGGDFRVDARRARTDATGTATFARLPAGRCSVRGDRCTESKTATIRAGETTELDFEIPLGLNFTGVVVDAGGEPIADALVEVAPLGMGDIDAEVLATTDEEGRFDIRDATIYCLISARADGFAASPMKLFAAKEGNAAEVRIELTDAGGSVDGVVVGPDGKPVVAAIVVVGSGRTSGIAASQDAAPPLPALVHNDEHGAFHAVGIKAGRQPVFAHAPGFAPFHGECNVVADDTTSFNVTLAAGATVRGVVRDAAGLFVKDAEVSFGDWGDYAHLRTFTSAEGIFELIGLPAGRIELHAEQDESGKGSRSVVADAGEVVACEIELSRGIELKGRVVDESHVPVENVEVLCSAERQGVWGRTDRDGRFAIANCPASAALHLTASGEEIEPLYRDEIDPRRGELELVVHRKLPATARISGLVVTPDGKPVANAQVCAIGTVRENSRPFWPTGADGRFDIGPFPPDTWRVVVKNSDFPTYTSAPRVLAANATCDLGTIELASGGWATVTIDGERATTGFQILDASETRLSWLDLNGGAHRRSEVLAPGDYRVLAFGDHVATQTVSFTIRAATETPVEIHMKPGVRQIVEIAPLKELAAPDGVKLRVVRGGELVLTWSLLAHQNEPTMEELWLAPGDYSATVSVAGHEGRATFTVGSEEGPKVAVEVK